MSQIKTMFSALCTLTFLLSFCHNTYAKPPEELLTKILNSYNPHIQTTVVGSKNLGYCKKTAIKIQGTDPLLGTLRDIHIQDYTPSKISDVKNLKTIIVLPPTGGENVLDRGYADYFCSRGFRVALVESWYGDTLVDVKNLDSHDDGALRSISAVRHVVEYLHPTRPDQLGILGTSVGALTAALLLGYEPRISAGTLIVGGGNMPEIISASTEQHLTALRQKRFELFQFQTVEDYKKALLSHVIIDPLDFIHFSGVKKILMVNALKDTTVPTKNQFELYKALGSKDLLTYDGDHIQTIIHTYVFEKNKILQFFKSHLR